MNIYQFFQSVGDEHKKKLIVIDQKCDFQENIDIVIHELRTKLDEDSKNKYLTLLLLSRIRNIIYQFVDSTIYNYYQIVKNNVEMLSETRQWCQELYRQVQIIITKTTNFWDFTKNQRRSLTIKNDNLIQDFLRLEKQYLNNVYIILLATIQPKELSSIIFQYFDK